MDDKLVVIAEYDDYIQAEMAKQVLEDFGIKVIVVGQNASNVYGGMLPALKPKLLVMQSQAEEAKKILEEQNEISEIEEPDESQEQ
ncbi:MAG: DUF2007 domain-containing protein [Phycisphaerae bacterium]